MVYRRNYLQRIFKDTGGLHMGPAGRVTKQIQIIFLLAKALQNVGAVANVKRHAHLRKQTVKRA